MLRFAPNDAVARLFPNEVRTVVERPSKVKQARCLRSGRINPKDTWELNLRKDELVDILKDQGKDWYQVRNPRGLVGFAHATWLDFNYPKHARPATAYVQFQKYCEKLFRSGDIITFPDVSEYIDVCGRSKCKEAKEGSNGPKTCVHDLERLLKGSGCYSYAFLKEERIKWHPDMFARRCHPNARELLTKKAEAMFVMIGNLMDALS